MKKITLLFVALVMMLVVACSKTNIESKENTSATTQETTVNTNRSNFKIGATFSLIKSSTGVYLYADKTTNSGKDADNYIVKANLNEGALIDFSGTMVNLDKCNILPSSPVNPTQLLLDKNAFQWNKKNTNTKLFATGNGTFFWYDGRPCSNYTTSAFPVKNGGNIMTVGTGGSSDDLKLKKKVFYIKESIVNNVVVRTAGVTDFIDNQSASTYTSSSITTKFNSYKYAMVGFEATQQRSLADYYTTGRTLLGVKNNSVYIIFSKSSSKNTSKDLLKNFMLGTDSDIVLLDGSGSTQLTSKDNLNQNYAYINGDRNIPNVINFYSK